MKNLYIVKFFLLMLLLGSSIDNVYSQYHSTETVGGFKDVSSWVGGVVPNQTWQTITISQNSEITYEGDFSWAPKVTINGDFRVNGKFTGGSGGVVVNGMIKVNGAFMASGSLEVGDSAKVNVIGDFDMGGGATANIKGDLNIEGNLVASGNKFIIHNGVTVTVNGNVDANVPIEVKDGGTLIVNGDYKNGQSLIVQANGLVKVSGEYNSNGDLKNSGVLLVTGNYINNSGGVGISVLDKGLLDIGGNLIASKNVKVEKGGVLIVHGNLTSTDAGINIEGTALIIGNFSSSSSTTINNSGNLVVGGDFAHAGGGMSVNKNNLYILNPDANVTYPPGWNGVIENGNYGDADDFIANEGDDLKDLVDSVMPDTVSPKYKWVGSQNSVWTKVENWNGSLPRSKSSVIINQSNNNPEILSGYGLVELNGLTIEPGAVLTLKPGAKLTVNGGLDIKQEGGLLLKNTYTPNGLASLITHGAVTGKTSVQLTLPNNEWYYLSSPMKNPDYSHFGAEKDGARVYAYRKQWVQYPSASPLQGLEGTLTIFDSEDKDPNAKTTISYIGELNTGSVSRSLTSKGYYLFGNPYPTSISWQDKNWIRDRVYGTIWYRTRVNQEMAFITYNRHADPGARVAMYPDNTPMWDEGALAFIPPYQSVWIYSKTASVSSPVTLTVTPNQRNHGVAGGTLKSSKGGSKTDILRVVVENESSRDGAVIYFSENSTDDFDPGDSPKYFNSSKRIPEIYTRSAGQTLAINGLSRFEESLDLPLSVRNQVDGVVNMSFDMSLYRTDDVVLLHDTYLDTEINLRKVSQYRYEPFTLGDNHDRFVIRFNPENYEEEDVSTPIDENTESSADHLINITGVNGRAIVSIDRELLQTRAGEIEVFNVAGAKISEFKAITNKTFIVLPETPGVYLVVVRAGGKMKSKKLVR